MVGITYADPYGREIGFIDKVSGDFTIGTENTFQLSIPSSYGIGRGYYVMIDGTEYGGMVDAMEIDTSQEFVTISGPTWHGLLAAQLVKPDAGSTYHTVSGELNAVLQSLIERIGLSERMMASSAPSGFSVSNYSFSRISTQMDAYTGIREMLKSAGAKLRIEYSSAERKAVLSAIERADHTKDGLDGERADFVIRQTRPVNHLHCLGIGEGASRTTLDLYADAEGNISKTQTIFGMHHREEAFENSSSDAADLEESGIEHLKELQEAMSSCALVGADEGTYDIDDIVGGTSLEHGVTVVTSVAQKIATVSSDQIAFETKTAQEVS